MIESKNNKTIEKAYILDCYFDVVTLSEAIDWAIQFVKSGKNGYICTVNVAILIMMRTNIFLKEYVNNSNLTVADGQPIVWFSFWTNKKLPERVTGIDFVERLLKKASVVGYRIYFLGATYEIISKFCVQAKIKYPQLNICGFNDGYFSEDKKDEIVKDIQNNNTQILIVGMGVPKQEKFIKNNWAELGVNLAIGVGGSFDVIAGVRNRAPFFMQKMGLEWLYRLIQEPQRLWKRYAITNTKFIYYVILQVIKKVFY